MTNLVAQTKPEPAANQVWAHSIGGEHVIADTDTEGRVRLRGKAYNETTRGCLVLDPWWSCVGIETPAGRVMVGERRLYGAREMVVTRIADGRHITAEQFGVPASDREYVASGVAQWPLLPPLPQGPAPDTIPRPSGCRCQWEQGDSECAVHPTCGECGCVVCECEPKGLPCRLSVMGRGCEGGPGIARLDIDIPEPTVAPDVVHTWEGWALP